MYIYIYDSFLNQKKYERIIAHIETRITDFGLNGKVLRLGIMKNPYEMIDYELKRGAKTIVAVGNDFTVNQVLNSMIDSNIPLGIIPVGKDNNLIAQALGIDLEEGACETLSARRVTKIDLGLANDIYFISQASIPNGGTTIDINKNYSVEILDKGEINIINMAVSKDESTNHKINPQDGMLELIIKTFSSGKLFSKQIGQSFFPLNRLNITNKTAPLVLDGVVTVPTPAAISIYKHKIKVIVGKDRDF